MLIRMEKLFYFLQVETLTKDCYIDTSVVHNTVVL